MALGIRGAQAHGDAPVRHTDAAQAEAASQPGPRSLVRQLVRRLERLWRGEAVKDGGDIVALTEYRAQPYLRRRTPDEIEAVLATIGQEDLHMVQQSFGSETLDVSRFAEAIVKTGTYDSERLLAFVGGIVDLFLEVSRSQAEWASDSPEAALNWGQLMNHLIEDPSVANFQGSEATTTLAAKAQAGDRGPEKLPQVARNGYVDCAKHQGPRIEKMYWIPYVDMVATVEGKESIYLWSPHVALEAPKTVTPTLPADVFGEGSKSLWSVLAVAWDPELQDLVALLSNRMLIVFRLRNREKAQFQQKREFRFHSIREKDCWSLYLSAVDTRTGEDIRSHKDSADDAARSEQSMRREKRDERLAADASTQLDIWWNATLKCWVTTDRGGRLFLWDLRGADGSLFESRVQPMKVLTEHSNTVTSHQEIGKMKFTTTSLDRSVILWDTRNLTMETRIGDHTRAVLSQTYLQNYSSLVTVGCERRVYVWSIDETSNRGLRAKLSQHQANVLQVSSGTRLFFTLDEAFILIMWDGANLGAVQSINCKDSSPRVSICLPTLGRICVAGRRLNYYEGNELAQIFMGVTPTKEQLARAKSQQEEGLSARVAAQPRWCGLSSLRGQVMSVTEAEVRLHERGCPAQSRPVFNTVEGDTISAFAADERLAVSVVGTSSGAIHFLKYRSGFPLKVYPGRRDDHEEFHPVAGSPAAASSAPTGDHEGSIRSVADASSESQQLRREASGGAVGSSAALLTDSRSNSPVLGGMQRRSTPQSLPISQARSRGSMQSATPALPAEESPPAEAERSAAASAGGSTTAQNAPSQEDVQRGLSGHITCVLPCEETRQVYVGTAEAQVLVFDCDKDYAVTRWLRHPDYPGAVTCLEIMTEVVQERAGLGLLVVGTQEGAAHLYRLDSLRLVGSVNIPRALPDEAGAPLSALRHLRLFKIPCCEPRLPLSLLTIDAQSRLRFWGLQVQAQSGKLKELKLLFDGGQLRESDGITTSGGEAIDAMVLQDKAAAVAATGLDAPVPPAVRRKASRDPVQITALATTPMRLPAPEHALSLQPLEGPRGAAEVANMLAEAAALEASRSLGASAPEAGPASGAPAFMTQTPGGALAVQGDLLQEAAELHSGSDTDGDAEDAMTRKLIGRPRTPSVKVGKGAVTDGSNLIWIGDSGGWIWCIDLAASAAEATAQQPGSQVLLEPPSAASGGRTSFTSSAHNHRNRSFRSTRTLGTVAKQDEMGVLQGRPSRPRPEALKVVGAWPAHHASVISIVPAGTPPVLVSMDSAKEVKVWSTAGHLWGHFSTAFADGGVPPTVAIWPPPQVLAAQVVLMRSAKNLCKRMGFDKLMRKAQHSPRSGSKSPRRTANPASQRSQSRAVALDDAALGGSDAGNMLASPAVTPATLGLPSPEYGGARLETSLSEEPSGYAASCAESADDGEGDVPEHLPEEDAGLAASSAAPKGASPGGPSGDASPGPTLTIRSDARSPRSGASEADGITPVSRGSKTLGKGADKLFTSSQMGEMIRNNAFSSGCRNYTQFVRRAETRRVSPKSDGMVQLDRTRAASNFGVELFSSKEARAWEANSYGLGTRSSSEGALLRYATQAVDEMTRSVKDNLGVDVTTTTRREMSKQSFIARLDIGGVSSNPLNPASATAQAAKKVLARDAHRVSLPFLRDGSKSSGSGRSASAGRLQRAR